MTRRGVLVPSDTQSLDPCSWSPVTLQAMLQLTTQQTLSALPYPALADSLMAVLRDKREGKAYAPDRLSVPLAGGGMLLLMPAADGQIGITKLVTVHGGNTGSGLPLVQAEV